MTDKTIYGCGYNGSGQLGNGGSDYNAHPLLTLMTGIPAGKTVLSVSCGGSHTMVLMTDKTIYGCGQNYYGQLGIDSSDYNAHPLLTLMTNTTGKTPLSVSCGGSYTMVLMTDGTVYGCGQNYYGQLGIGSSDYNAHPLLTLMTNTTGKTPLSVSCWLSESWRGSFGHTMVLMTDGSLYGCGSNSNGQLGNNIDQVPTNVLLVPMINTTGKIPLAVSCGESYTIVLMTDGSLYGCGSNSNGQLGNNSTIQSNSLTPMTMPVLPPNVKSLAISCGASYTMVLMTNGYVYGCGLNNNGQLGDNSIIQRNSLTQMSNTTSKTMAYVYCGVDYTMVLMTDKTVYGCGANRSGQLGIGINESGVVLTPMSSTPADKTPLLGSYGSMHTIVLMTDKTVYGCGYNYYGQLGDGTQASSTSLIPMPIPPGKTPLSVSCGLHTMVLMTDKTIYGCGYNQQGQLGNNIDDQVPTNVSLVPMINTTGKIPLAVYCAEASTIVLMTDKTIYGCGYNGYGQLGAGPDKKVLTLIPNTTGKIPVYVSCGYYHTMVLMTDGTVYGCGANWYGQLGVGLPDYNAHPSLTLMTNTTGKTVISVSCGNSHTMVVMADGSVFGCGLNAIGQLGNGTTTPSTTLTPLTMPSNLPSGVKPLSVSCGISHTKVIMTDGTVYVCGNNDYGQLGIGRSDNDPHPLLTQIKYTNLLTNSVVDKFCRLSNTIPTLATILSTYSLAGVRPVGYTKSEFVSESIALSALKSASYTAFELKIAGYTINELLAPAVGFVLADLVLVGYTKAEFVSASITLSALKSAGFSDIVLKTAGYTSYELISNICFIAGTPVTTDQGNIPIEKIDSAIHTIRNKKIVAITKTVTQDKYLVCFEKDALGKNIPSLRTTISKNHNLFYNGKMRMAKEFLKDFDNVVKVKYTKEILYNVLLEEHDKMMVNNLICETLHPENGVAKVYMALQTLSSEDQQSLIKKINAHVIKNNVFNSKKLLK